MVIILPTVMWINWWILFDPQKMPPLTTSSSLYIYTLLLLSEMNDTYGWSSLDIISLGKILTHHGCHVMDGRAFLFTQNICVSCWARFDRFRCRSSVPDYGTQATTGHHEPSNDCDLDLRFIYGLHTWDRGLVGVLALVKGRFCHWYDVVSSLAWSST